MPTPTTIRDVARHAGVSIKTVSRVLNDERYVREETRARVRAAVDALHFHPSLAARSLSGKRSFQIALICDNPNPYYIHEMQRGIRSRAAQDGVRLIVQPYDRGGEDLLDDIGALVNAMRVDGLILTPPVTDRREVLDLLLERGLSLVRVQPGADRALTPATGIDNIGAAKAMTEYLIECGHRRIGFVRGPADFLVSAEREAGYRQALAAADIAFDPCLLGQGDFSPQSGMSAAQGLIDRSASAIFAASDTMAAGVIAEGHRRGLRLPDDLSVAGFDDSALAASIWPPLATVRQPLYDLGWQAADLLLAKAPPEDGWRLLPFEIIERGSVAKPS